MPNLTINLNEEKTGLTALMKPYTAVLMMRLWDKATSRNGIGSGELWRFYNEYAKKHGMPSRSRASVIFECNELVEAEILDYYDATGKGGHHKLYFPKVEPEDFEDHVRNTTEIRLNRIFLGESWWLLNGEANIGRATDTE